MESYEIKWAEQYVEDLRSHDAKRIQQITELQGTARAVCYAEDDYDHVNGLMDKSSDEAKRFPMKEIIKPDDLKLLAEKHYAIYLGALMNASKTQRFADCGEGGGGVLNEVLHKFTQNVDKYQIAVDKLGYTTAQIRSTGLELTKRELTAEKVYESLRSKAAVNPPADGEQTPLEQAQYSWRRNNVWEFNAKELGLTQAEVEILEKE